MHRVTKDRIYAHAKRLGHRIEEDQWGEVLKIYNHAGDLVATFGKERARLMFLGTVEEPIFPGATIISVPFRDSDH